MTKDKLRETLKLYQPNELPVKSHNAEAAACLQKQSPQSASHKNIDLPKITTLCQDIGCETVIHLLDAYIKEGTHIINQLATSKENEIYNLAHTLAGMSENLGMTEIARLSRLIMVSFKSTEKDLEPLTHQISKKFHDTVTEIDHVKRKIKN